MHNSQKERVYILARKWIQKKERKALEGGSVYRIEIYSVSSYLSFILEKVTKN
jgi:hypothetical protein